MISIITDSSGVHYPQLHLEKPVSADLVLRVIDSF